MALGFVMVGIAFGLGAAGAVLFAGAGLGAAFLAYVAGGMLGTGLGVMAALLPAPVRAGVKAQA